MKGYGYFLAIVAMVFASAFTGMFFKASGVNYGSEYIEAKQVPVYAVTENGTIEYHAAAFDSAGIRSLYCQYHYVGKGLVSSKLPPVFLYQKNTIEWMAANNLLTAK